MFLREGFAATSTDVIAREAGVSKRTLYAYYPSKEELFAEVLCRLTIENPQTRVLESVEDISPNSREELHGALVVLAKKIVETAMQPEYVALLRTIIADAHRFPQLGELFRETVPERGIKSFILMMERARQNGVVGYVEGEIAARTFMGPLITYLLLDGLFVTEGPPRPPDPEHIEKMVAQYMKSIA